MYFLSGTLDALPKEFYRRVLHFRHQVFIERLGWDLPVKGKIEQDQFDQPYALYVVAMNDEKKIIGCARLLPTSKPYLLSEVFPRLFIGKALPRSSKIWELSRFAVMDMRYTSRKLKKTICSNITLELLRNVISNARSRGVNRLITVSPVSIERLLRTTGCNYDRAGTPIIINNEKLVAFWIDCDRK